MKTLTFPSLLTKTTSLTLKALTAALMAGALLAPASAMASPIRECGRIDGTTKNLTTRNVSCQQARLVYRRDLRGFYAYGNDTVQHGRWNCRVRVPSPRSWWVDVRCTADMRVIRFQYLSGE